MRMSTLLSFSHKGSTDDMSWLTKVFSPPSQRDWSNCGYRTRVRSHQLVGLIWTGWDEGCGLFSGMLLTGRM